MKNNFELVDEIRRAEPGVPPIEIVRAVVKLRKLAKTIAKRQNKPYAFESELSKANTQKFYNKAYTIARKVRCQFEGRCDAPLKEWQIFLRIGGQAERIA